MNGQIYSSDGVNPALTTNKGEGNKVAISIDKGYERIGQTPYENGRVSGRTGVYDIQSGVPAMTATQGKDPYRVAIPVEDIQTNHGFNQRGVVHDVNGISRTVFGGGHCGNEPKVAIPVLTPDRANKRQNGRRFKEDGDPSFTLTGQDRHGVAVKIEPNTNRKER